MANCVKKTVPLLSSARSIVMYDYVPNAVNINQATVLYVPGFQGHGQGSKSKALIKHCQEKQIRYVCYDPEGLGESKAEDLSRHSRLFCHFPANGKMKNAVFTHSFGSFF